MPKKIVSETYFVTDCIVIVYCTAQNDPTDPSLAVVMYDVEVQQFINQQLIDLISFEAAAPVLKKVG